LPPRSRHLTEGSISRNLWYLAVPMMATNALQTLFNIVDMFFVGRIGPDAIAAVAVAGVIMMIPFSLILGLSVAAGAMVSRSFGARQFESASHSARQSLFSAVVGGFFVMLIGLLLAPHLIDLFGVEQSVHRLGTGYIRIIFIGTIPIAVQFLTAALFQAVGDAKTALWINAVAVLLNLLLDPMLIFGLGPFPRLEVAGAATATTIARSLGMVAALFFLVRRKSDLHMFKEGWHPDRRLIGRLIKIGVPSSLQMSLRSVSGIIMMGIVARYGTFALAAYGVGLRLDMLMLMPGFGLGAATATLVGQNLGAGKSGRAERSSWTAAANYAAIMTAAGCLFYWLAADIFFIFNSNVEVVNIGVLYLRTLVLSYPFLALAIILNRALSGAGETLKTMSITAFALFGVAVPLAYAIPALFDTGVRGIWIAIVLANITQALILTWVFTRGRWKLKIL